MITPIVMLILMIGPFVVVRSFSLVSHRDVDTRSAAAIGLGILFIFTGVGHFIQTEIMSEMLPGWVPERVLLVYVTGILEFAIACGFFIRRTRRFAGWMPAVVLVVFFPANIYAAMNQIPMGGHAWGPIYLVIRGPLQVAILLWVYWFTIKPPNRALDADVR